MHFALPETSRVKKEQLSPILVWSVQKRYGKQLYAAIRTISSSVASSGETFFKSGYMS